MKKLYRFIVIAAIIAVCAGCRAQTHEHSFGEWKTKTPAACESAEVEVRKCECGEEETRKGDPATGHSYTSITAASNLEKPMAGMEIAVSDLSVSATCACGKSVAVTDGIELEAATLALGKNTVKVKYGALSTVVNIDAAKLDIALDGAVVDDTYIYSSEKDSEYSSKKEMGTKSDLYRIYFRTNISEILNMKLFAANRENAKLQLILPVTGGSVTKETAFTLKVYDPAAGATDVDFSKITWNSVDNKEGAAGAYAQLHWNNGKQLVSGSVGHNVRADQGQIIVTLAYRQIADFVDENGNIVFAFATNTDGLKIGALENKTEANRPAIKIVLNDEHFHVFDQEVAEKKYFVSANCKEKAKYYTSCSCGAAGTEIFEYGAVIDHSYGALIPKVEKTCTTNGVKAHYRCTVCQKYFVEKNGQMVVVKAEDLKISAGHDYKLIQKKSASCTKDGNNKYYKCGVCEKYFDAEKNETTKDAQKIEALGHTYTSISAVSNLNNPMATTVVKASDLHVTGTCGRCGESVAITDGIELEGTTLVLGENTITVKYGKLSTTVTLNAAKFGVTFDGVVSDDTYISSSSNTAKDKAYAGETALNTNSSSYRAYFRVNVSEILKDGRFDEVNAKIQLILAVTSGSVTGDTTFTLKAYTPAAGVTDADFSDVTWNSVSSSGTYGALNWNEGAVLVSGGEGHNVSVGNSKITITLAYSQIKEFVDGNGNIVFVFATNTSGLKIGSLENEAETNRPVFKVFIDDEHFHVFDKEAAQEEYFVSANCDQKTKYYKSCSCGEAGADTFEYGEVIAHSMQTKYDENGHWSECDREGCDTATDKVAHSGGTATETQQAVCGVCNQPYGELKQPENSTVTVNGAIVDDTYVDSGNKDKDYSTSKTDLGVRTKGSTYYRSYFRFNFSDVLNAEGFKENKSNAKVQFTFAVTAGEIDDATTFTFYTFDADDAAKSVKFTDINWNSVASEAAYEQLGFNHSTAVALISKKTMSEADITYENGLITITVNYSDIGPYMDADGNCLLGLTTSAAELKIASMEHTSSAKPAVSVTYTKQSNTASGDGDVNVLTEEVIRTSEDEKVSATLPAGTKLQSDATAIDVVVTEKENSEANISLDKNEASLSLDVHVTGIASDNTAPIKITLGAVLPTGLNLGNYDLYHVENGVTHTMTLLEDGADPVHNSYEYDPATGEVVLYLASFSEVAFTTNTVNPWNGTIAEGFAGGTGTKTDPYIIANADQMAYFSQIVSRENDVYGSAYYKLVADINFGGDEAEKNDDRSLIFYPVGYWKEGEGANSAGEETWYTYGGAFTGVFDGNGHTISNIYQNTWLMDGDYDNGYWDAAMGIFGYVHGGTVKNLTVDRFSSDGEFTPTGVIAAYADGDSVFENIAITNCNPRVYNTGNGGIIGIAGDTREVGDDHIKLTNITVDNSNKISALWGSWDVACGGLVGMYRGNVDGNGNATGDTVVFTNCHVAARIDVYNDVCANYQYYAYRYSGMIIGSVRHNKTVDGHVYPDMTGITTENCTVHFGDWNDYYYCELVANSLASYTHDHQMSRLTQIAKIDVTNLKYLPLGAEDLSENWVAIPDGRVNYVVVNSKNEDGTWNHGDGKDFATCYHFVNRVQHFHDVADTDNPNPTETVNGVEGVLKEDKQIIYREFNNLFTGYGWGVTSKGLTDFDGVTNMDIQLGDQEDSVEKFKGKVTRLTNGITYKIGDIFALINTEVNLVPGALTVTVTNLDENGNVTAVFTRDEGNWENGTITLTGTGNVRITIQDYYFCTPTSVDVVVNAEGFIIGGQVTDDTYVDSGNKTSDFTAKETLNTNSSSYRSYFKVNIGNVLANQGVDKDNAKVQLILTVAGGNVTDTTTFTLKAYEPKTGVTDIAFSDITWSNVATDGTYSGLNWGGGKILEGSVSVADDKITITLDYSTIADYVDENGNILFAFGTNTSGLKVGSRENTTEAKRPVFNVILPCVYGKIVDDTYVDSGNKGIDFSTGKDELNVRNSNSNNFRSYFRFNFSDVLNVEHFTENKSKAKVKFTFAVTAGAIDDETTFTFYAFNVDEATDGVAFSDINWNSVASGAAYEQLGFNNGYTVSLVGKKTMSESGIAYNAETGLLTITVNYSDIEGCLDANGNCIFGLTTSSTDLKIASMEHTSFAHPAVSVIF